MKLLIVDDSSFARRKLKEAILQERPDLEVIDAVDGEDALRKLESDKPDYCITDLVMPKMDGLTFLRAARENDADVKLVVVSADIQEARKEECYQLGASAFIEKPVTKAKLAGLFAKLEER